MKRLLTILLLSACSSNSAPTTTSTTAEETTTVTPPTPPTSTATASAPEASSPAGAWKSPSCGERKYMRELTLNADGTYAARDLVSPCPPNVACVWSGIVDRKGTWAIQGSTVTLTPPADVKEKTPGSPFPRTLTFESGALSEAQGCTYSKS